MASKENIIIIIPGKHRIEIPEDTEIILTTPDAEVFSTCIYVRLVDGKFVFTGGASIVERIEGRGMAEKIEQ